jgi:hypothetical protein
MTGMFVVADTLWTSSEAPQQVFYWHTLSGACEARSLPAPGERLRVELPDGRGWVVTVRNRTEFKGQCGLSFEGDSGREITEGARILPMPVNSTATPSP